jgi:hypothetical protein
MVSGINGAGYISPNADLTIKFSALTAANVDYAWRFIEAPLTGVSEVAIQIWNAKGLTAATGSTVCDSSGSPT